MRASPLYPGFRTGRLTVIEEAARRNNRRHWRCVCDCGAQCTVSESHLKTGHTKSCGCITKELLAAKSHDLAGRRFGRLTAIRPVESGGRNGVRWLCRCDCGNEVELASEYLLRGKSKSCGCLARDKYRENMQNNIHFADGTCIEKVARQKEMSTNTSGHRGVCIRENGSWRATITFRGNRRHLGNFRTYEEAVAARLKAEESVLEYLEEYYARQEG